MELEDEEQPGGFLTNRQKEFSRLIVEGVYSNAECARRAGYSEKVAVKYAHKLLNGKDFPLVPQHIAELRQEHERKYGVTLKGNSKDYPTCHTMPNRKVSSLPPSTQKKFVPVWEG